MPCQRHADIDDADADADDQIISDVAVSLLRHTPPLLRQMPLMPFRATIAFLIFAIRRLRHAIFRRDSA